MDGTPNTLVDKHRLLPDSTESWQVMGDDFAAAEDWTAAYACYQSGIARTPENIALLERLAFVTQKLELWHRSQSYINVLLRLHPSHRRALMLQATILQKSARFCAALDCVERAIDEQKMANNHWRIDIGQKQ